MTPNSETAEAGLKNLFRQREGSVLALLIFTLLAVGAVNHAFLAPGNLRDLLLQSVPTIIAACGLTLVIVLGEIDISIGSMMGLLATLLGILTSPSRAGWPVLAGIAVVLLMGAGLGLLNGLLVTMGRMPSIIVTLAMLTILQGVNLTLMNGQWITDLPPGLRFFGIGTVLGIPFSLWTAGDCRGAVCPAHAGNAARTPDLRGGQPPRRGASRREFPRNRLKIFAFTLTGFLTALATVVSVPRLSVVESGIGSGFELLVVTCVVVGGTRISGGRGAILGSVLAALLLGLVRPMLIFLHLGVSAEYWEKAIQGAFILAAVLADQATRRRFRGDMAA